VLAREIRAHIHYTKQHGSTVRIEHEFFGELCDVLEGIDEVLVSGSHTAVADFRHYAGKHRPQTAAHIVGYEVVDHPSENQLVALARKFHPDVSKAADASTRMQEINEAYEVLRDKEKRAAYDQVGQGWNGGQEFRPPPGRDSGFEFSGPPGASQGAGNSHDHSAFFDALFGAARRAEGHVEMRERKLSVSVPKGIRSGQQIRLTGQGSPGFGSGVPGALYLEIEFAPHRLYRPDGRDLYLTLPVAPWEAALGSSVQVPTPDGSVEMTIPPGSQTGRKLRLRGRGIPGMQEGTPGDFYVVLEVVLPPAADYKARALGLDSFALACGAEVEFVRALVEIDLVQPLIIEGHWHFSGEALTRARRIRRLQRDFEAKLETVAVIIDPMDEIERMHAHMNRAGNMPR
jgi:curved DNA-binding protein